MSYGRNSAAAFNCGASYRQLVVCTQHPGVNHSTSHHTLDMHCMSAHSTSCGPSRNSNIAHPCRSNSDEPTPAKTIGHQLTSNDMTGECYVARKEQCGGMQLWGLIQTMGRMHLAPRRESLHESSRHRHGLHNITCG